MTTDTVLELNQINVTVPDGTEQLTILDRVDLAVAPGEVVMITGASGSGKSTLLAVAALLRRPTAGTVRIGGTDTTNLSGTALARLRNRELGMVFQTSNLFPSLTAREQVELVAHISGQLNRSTRARAAELLDAVGLGDKADRLPAQLSGGERQRIGIARALMNEPKVLLADEPTAALDERRGREVMQLLVNQARQHGAATLIVTHNPDQLGRPDRHLHLHSGTLEPGELTAHR